MQRQNVVTTAMRDCTRNMLFGIAVVVASVSALVALVACVGYIAPRVGDLISIAWYGWGRILTRDYTSVPAAAWVEWGSLLVVTWALCVTIKLARMKARASVAFGGLTVAVFLFGLLPAQSALFVMCSDWTLSERPLFEQLAGGTGLFVYLLGIVGGMGLVLYCGIEVLSVAMRRRA